MKYLIQPRQTGRTTKLIEWVKEKEGRCLIVMDSNEEHRLVREDPSLKHKVLNVNAFGTRSTQWVKFKEIAIDNADYVLQRMFDIPISIISLTGGEK